MNTDRTCCFIGHRDVAATLELSKKLYVIIEMLITEKHIDTFIFGSKSSFDELCRKTVTEIKEKHPHIRRIYARAEHPFIDDSYKAYLLQFYDDTYFPAHMLSAGRASYVERNLHMIDNSRVCVVYYDSDYTPSNRKSGTKIAFDYAVKRKRTIINIKDI